MPGENGLGATRPGVRDVVSAGAVVTRKGGDVLLVHRPRYDDWSFPKGKVDRGEHVAVAAVREVGEETGLLARLGPPLSPQRYPIGRGRMKTVHYWVARVVGSDDLARYVTNKEIDDVRWVPRAEVPSLLSYDFDRDTLGEARGLAKRSRAVLVLRHSKARSRKAWRGDDRLRPLLKPGEVQAARLVPLLAAYDVEAVLSSSSVRCRQTVAPYAEFSGWPIQALDGLSEEDATDDSVLAVVDHVLHHEEAVVVCTHRPVLPAVFDALGVDQVKLEPGGMIVVHHRHGRVLATEHHQVR